MSFEKKRTTKNTNRGKFNDLTGSPPDASVIFEGLGFADSFEANWG